MTNVRKSNLSLFRKDLGGITRAAINNSAPNKYPAIHVDSNLDVEISQTVLTANGQEIKLINSTIIEVVQFMNDVGVNATLTKGYLAGYPAILLTDFMSSSFKEIEVLSSPYDISKVHTEFVYNLLNLSDGITRDVVSVSSGDFRVVDNLLFSNAANGSSRAIIKYSIDKYFLFVSTENILDSYGVVENNSIDSTIGKDMVLSLNSLNKKI